MLTGSVFLLPIWCKVRVCVCVCVCVCIGAHAQKIIITS